MGSQEVVVEAREVGTATGQEAQAGVDLENNHVLAVDNVEDVLLLLGDLLLQNIDMLDDGSRARKGRGGRHIVQRRGVSQQRRAGRSQELLISGRHGDADEMCATRRGKRGGSRVESWELGWRRDDLDAAQRERELRRELDEQVGELRTESDADEEGRREGRKTRIQNKHVES